MNGDNVTILTSLNYQSSIVEKKFVEIERLVVEFGAVPVIKFVSEKILESEVDLEERVAKFVLEKFFGSEVDLEEPVRVVCLVRAELTAAVTLFDCFKVDLLLLVECVAGLNFIMSKSLFSVFFVPDAIDSSILDFFSHKKGENLSRNETLIPGCILTLEKFSTFLFIIWTGSISFSIRLLVT
ncbi:hypothetical protein BpHYR1_016827 [Brachionus plicatilis]|uniref:Uncharacterized protein n=1 Tax=Brachionus plicatilis TaxID=10195 RepID=A0A3M7SG92_BRAPC|nr:hypothetical protein BpHYR1_016827 [Brachionus plicatilis]